MLLTRTAKQRRRLPLRIITAYLVTCPFLVMCIASMPSSLRSALVKVLAAL
jgi:hypothetical protein